MTTNVVTIAPNALLTEAYSLLREKRISIIVVEQMGRAVGLLTERDVIGIMHDNINASQTTIASVMTSPVKTISHDMQLFDAYSVLTENHFRHLVVANDDGLLAGVVTLTDMLDGMGMEHFVDLKQVSAIMATNLIRVRQQDSLRLVIDLMHRHRISCVVVAEEWRPVGIITERDIVKYSDQGLQPDNIKVSTVMSSPVRTMSDSSYIPEVNKIMHEERLRHMVVVDHQGRLSGLISQSDLTGCMDVGYIAYLKGVIEQREKKISAIQHEHNAFLSDNPNAVIAFDASGQVIDANPAALRLIATDLSSIQRKHFIDLVCTENRDQAQLLFKQACQSLAVHGELLMQSESGTSMIIFNSFVPIKRDDELRMVYAVMHDVSDSRMAEQRLHQSERHFKALAELSHAMHWVLDLTTNRFTYVSKQFEQQLGYPLDSWESMETWAARIHAEDRQEALMHCSQATEQESDVQFSCRMIAADGRQIPVQAHISALHQTGQAVELRGFMSQISEIRGGE